MARALVLVDVQRNKLEGERPLPHAHGIRPRLQKMLDRARLKGAPVVFVQNDGDDGDPDAPGTPGWELALAPLPGETVVRKSVGNAFQQNPDLDDRLRALDVNRVVIAGMESPRCVRSTALGALALGFEVDLASGAHAAYAEHQSADVIATAVEQELAVEGASIVWWSGALN